MHIAEFFAILAAICLIPSLYRGAVQDLKEFKFSAEHFNSLWVNAGAILVILAYVAFLLEGLWLIPVEFIILSVIASLIFTFAGFRFGGGGDWRALSYISWIAPFMLINVICLSAICGIVQAFIWISRRDIEIPPMYRKIPFAVSIFAGFVLAAIWFAATVLFA